MSNIGGKVYFITGTSGGIGLELVISLLSQSMRVAATSRNKKQLIENIKSRDPSLILNENQFLPIEMDIKSEHEIKKAVNETIERFGSLYCVINNCGYALKGGVDELMDKEVRDNFEVNFFGPLSVLRYSIPHLKSHQYNDPRIINISSTVGFNGEIFENYSSYIASKFALDGLTECLSTDLKSNNIKVTTVKPGYFKTPFNDHIVYCKNITEKQREKEEKEKRDALDPNIPKKVPSKGSCPIKGANAIIKISLDPSPPLHLFLGSDSLKSAEKKINKVQSDINQWIELSKSTDNL